MNTPTNPALIAKILAYMQKKGYTVFTEVGQLNIVYIEGMNPDGTLNRDLLDGWNDLRLVFDHDAEGQARMLHLAVATTEPGRAATFSPDARRRGGVARIQFGQHTAWRIGVHKNTDHPALVQRAPILVHRDANRDGIRTRDNVGPATGINQHSTRPGFRGEQVGTWSEGCLVGLDWDQHLEFMRLVLTDPRGIRRNFLYTSTILPGNEL